MEVDEEPRGGSRLDGPKEGRPGGRDSSLKADRSDRGSRTSNYKGTLK